MKPQRLIITHELIVQYGLYQKMNIYKPIAASAADMKKFHSEDYVYFLQAINVHNVTNEIKGLMGQFDIGTKENDCPIFEGMFKFAQISAGSSLAAAAHINDGAADIAINWSGGLHHAKKSQASGFCYINDIVLCILELLKVHRRVLYVDIDIHHADGVEEAFCHTDRVMTVSFHRYGRCFFPGTGAAADIGIGKGEGYSVNVPLKSGIVDEDYETVFVPIMMRVVQLYCPDVIVMQCGSDSISGDQLGDFNLTLEAHGRCVRFMRDFNIPLILLGNFTFKCNAN
jgi:acetoin utilization deacetylase AcuC-like enzyme